MSKVEEGQRLSEERKPPKPTPEQRFQGAFGLLPNEIEPNRIIEIISQHFSNYCRFKEDAIQMSHGEQKRRDVLGRLKLTQQDFDQNKQLALGILDHALDAAQSFVEQDLAFIRSFSHNPYFYADFEAMMKWQPYPDNSTTDPFLITAERQEILKGNITLKVPQLSL